MDRLVTLTCCAAILLLVAQPLSAELIANGDFESLVGEPPFFEHWIVSGSSAGALVQETSAISGQYSAEIVPSITTADRIHQVFTPLSEYFNFSMDFAAFPVGNDRTLHLELGNRVIHMAVRTGNKLYAYPKGGTGVGFWTDLGLDPILTTTPRAQGFDGSWDGEEPVVNNLRIVGYLAADEPYYSVTLNGQTVISDVFYQTNFTSYPVDQVRFRGHGVNSNWLVDNVSMVPEPGTAMLLTFGLLGLLVFGGRRQRR